MDSTAFLPSSWSNSTIDRNLIAFGTVDFRPHPPTLVPIFSNLYQEMDQMIGSFKFHVGSLGSLRLSHLIYLGLSANKIAAAAISETSVGSSSEANSPVSIRPAESKRSIIDPHDEIMENLDFKESSDQSLPNIGLEETSDSINNYSK
jgi:hypothetical protein